MKKISSFFFLSVFVILSGCNFSQKDAPEQNELIRMIQAERNLKKDVSFQFNVLSNDAQKAVVEVLVQNPSLQKIESIRAWMSFPPQILQGEKIEWAKDLPIILSAPGEDTFDNETGMVKIGVSLDSKKEAKEIFSLATITFEKKQNETAALSFFDVRSEGHTLALISYEGNERNVLSDSETMPLMIPAEE